VDALQRRWEELEARRHQLREERAVLLQADGMEPALWRRRLRRVGADLQALESDLLALRQELVELEEQA
jgi:prefoldin subunit 5